MPGTPGLTPEAASYAQYTALLADLEASLRCWLSPRGLSHLDNYILKLARRDADLWEYEHLLAILAWRFCGVHRDHAHRAVAAHCYAKARQTARPPLRRLLGVPPGFRPKPGLGALWL